MNLRRLAPTRCLILLSVHLSVWCLALSSARSENWPQFRGPRGDGSSLEKGIAVEWDREKNVLWKKPVSGEGHSSPIIWDQSLFLTAYQKETQQRILLRLDAERGDVVWQRVLLTAPAESMHRENSPASSTPITDGQHVFTSFQNGPRVDVQCYDFSGRQIWSAQPLSFEGMHGYSYTPVLYQDLVIFDFSQNEESAVVALEKDSGRVRWRYDRRRKEISHVAPLLLQAAGKTQLIICGGDEIRSFDPATGQAHWWSQGPTEVCVAGLAYGDGLLFATGGYPRKTRLAIGVSGQGDVSESHVAWKTFREVTYVPSPVYFQSHLYTVLDDGMLHCFDARTGQSVWEERLKGRFRSSLVLSDQNIYATNDQGLTTVFRASPQGFQPVARNDLNEFCYATPALARGRLYLRTAEHLYCIGRRAGSRLGE